MIYFLAFLAVWRLSHMLAKDDGPWGIFARLHGWSPDPIRDLFNCIGCLSMWVSIPFAIAIAHGWVEGVCLWLALSTGSLMLEAVYDMLWR